MIGEPVEDEPEHYDAYASEPPFRPRRNKAKMWTILAVAAALLMLAATAAIAAFGLPKWGGLSMGGERQASTLTIEDIASDRTPLASGNGDMLTVSGRIVNPTDAVQPVPQLQAELRDGQGRPVYRWPISPPISELQPGQSVTFNSGEVGTPRSARRVNISLGAAG